MTPACLPCCMTWHLCSIFVWRKVWLYVTLMVCCLSAGSDWGCNRQSCATCFALADISAVDMPHADCNDCMALILLSGVCCKVAIELVATPVACFLPLWAKCKGDACVSAARCCMLCLLLCRWGCMALLLSWNMCSVASTRSSSCLAVFRMSVTLLLTTAGRNLHR